MQKIRTLGAMGWFSSDEIITNTAAASSEIEEKITAGALCIIALAIILVLVFKVFNSFSKYKIAMATQREVRLQCVTASNT